MNRSTYVHPFLVILSMFAFSLFYVGCGGSEEAMSEDEMVTDIGYYDEGAEEEVPAEGMDEQTDTTEQFAEEPVQETPQQETAQQETAPVEQPEGPSHDQLQADLDAMKTENIQLKDQLSASEQANRDLMAKVSDLEAANLALQKQITETPVAVKATPSPVTPGKSTPEEINAYKSSVSKFNAKSYADAINELQTLLNSGIKDDYADNCHYWIGLSYFQTKEYDSAIKHFQQVMNYRFSEKKDDSQIMIARTYERMGNKEQALTEYQKLVDMYPTSEWVGRARARLR
ncbi:MAG: tetratricopeptide repeat protein [Bacteroidota bacterium]